MAVPRVFVGRDDDLEKVQDRLRARKRVVMRGLRGVGKTVLAASLALKLKGEYDVIWWFDAASDAGMRSGMIRLGLRLGWIDEAVREREAVARIDEALRDTDLRVLLILDNAVDARSLKPAFVTLTSADLLITSNSAAWRRLADVVEIRPWAPSVGAHFLAERTGHVGQDRAAADLALALGGLPLALEQAGAYCEYLNVTFVEYLRRFRAQPLVLLDDVDHADPAYRDSATTVARTFALAIEAANALHPAAEALIQRAALVADEVIPFPLMEAAFRDEGDTGELASNGFERALAALATVALVEVESIADDRARADVTRTLRLHRLVRLVASARCAEAEKEALLGDLIHAMKLVYPREVDDDASVWPLARMLDPHLSHLLPLGAPIPSGCEEDTSWLLDRLATYRHLAQGDYAGAESLHLRALELDTRHFGPDHTHVAADLNNLAELKRGTSQLLAAEKLYARAAEIYAKDPRQHASKLSNIENNRAELLRGRGDHAAAESLYRHAIALEEERDDPDFISLAKYYGNLAILLATTHRFPEAESEIKYALVLNVRLFGKYNPSVAADLNTFAEILRATDRYDRAERLFRSAWRIVDRCLPLRHPNRAIHLTNFADFLRTTNRPAQAEALLREALSIVVTKNIPGDVATAVTMHKLALVIKGSDARQARSMLKEAVSIFLAYAKANVTVHRLMWPAVASYVDLCRAEFGLSEQEAHAELSALADTQGLKLTF